MAEYFVTFWREWSTGTLYIEIRTTSRRLGEHRAGTADTFTKYRSAGIHVERFDTVSGGTRETAEMGSRLEDSVD
jgi:hypothetical protein